MNAPYAILQEIKTKRCLNRGDGGAKFFDKVREGARRPKDALSGQDPGFTTSSHFMQGQYSAVFTEAGQAHLRLHSLILLLTMPLG